MTWDGRTADQVWLTCFDCDGEPKFREVDYRHHIKTAHRERPEEDALTPDEVAEALGVNRTSAARFMRLGRIRAFRMRGWKPQWWVRRKDLKAYVMSKVETDPELAKRWAATGIVR